MPVCQFQHFPVDGRIIGDERRCRQGKPARQGRGVKPGRGGGRCPNYSNWIAKLQIVRGDSGGCAETLAGLRSVGRAAFCWPKWCRSLFGRDGQPYLGKHLAVYVVARLSPPTPSLLRAKGAGYLGRTRHPSLFLAPRASPAAVTGPGKLPPRTQRNGSPGAQEITVGVDQRASTNQRSGARKRPCPASAVAWSANCQHGLWYNPQRGSAKGNHRRRAEPLPALAEVVTMY